MYVTYHLKKRLTQEFLKLPPSNTCISTSLQSPYLGFVLWDVFPPPSLNPQLPVLTATSRSSPIPLPHALWNVCCLHLSTSPWAPFWLHQAERNLSAQLSLTSPASFWFLPMLLRQITPSSTSIKGENAFPTQRTRRYRSKDNERRYTPSDRKAWGD